MRNNRADAKKKNKKNPGRDRRKSSDRFHKPRPKGGRGGVRESSGSLSY